MRSDLVFEAIHYIPNRYELCQWASKATRSMHRPDSCIAETTNQVLGFLPGEKSQTAPVQKQLQKELERRS
jgi:hypothetical protein